MKLIAVIGNTPKNSMKIYHKIVAGKNYWCAGNRKAEFDLCDSFDQAVKYACEYLGLLEYEKNI